MFLIVLNMLILCVKWHEEPAIVSVSREYLNYIFTGIFLAEILIRVLALGFRKYFIEGWNIFDAVVILGSFVSISANSSVSLKGAGVFTILRSFRVVRLLRLRERSLQVISNTIAITFRVVANLGGLLLLIIFIYTVIGMMLLGNVRHSGLMNDWINFEHFTNAFITLFIVSTGDSWNTIMSSFAQDNNPSYQCIQRASFEDLKLYGMPMGCGNKYVAFSFFISYIIIVNLVFLKIFIAVTLQGYTRA
jgi:hypothetical protein